MVNVSDTEILHEGCLSEQKSGKFAKRWVVLERCKVSGCIFVKTFRYVEGERNPLPGNLRHEFQLSQDEFIGSVKGKCSSSRTSSFYWTVILKSEKLQFQDKSMYVCDKWTRKIREHIQYYNWEVKLVSGFKYTNSNALFFLSEHLLSLCCSDLSKVLCCHKVTDVLHLEADECIVKFSVADGSEEVSYQVEVARTSQAKRIVEEILASQKHQEENNNACQSSIKAPTATRTPFHASNISLEDSFNGIGDVFKVSKPYLTPPSTPNNISPAASPCPSPRSTTSSSRKGPVVDGLCDTHFPLDVNEEIDQAQDSSTLSKSFNHSPRKFGNQLKAPGPNDWARPRRGAIRRHNRSNTAPETVLQGNDAAPSVASRPTCTLPPRTTHLSLEQYDQKSNSLSLSHARAFSEMNSISSYECKIEDTCILPGPVLPQPIQVPGRQPQRNPSSVSMGSSLSDEPCVNTCGHLSPMASPNSISPNPRTESSPTSGRLSASHNGDIFFSDKGQPPPVPRRSSKETETKPDQDGRRTLLRQSKIVLTPIVPARVESLARSMEEADHRKPLRPVPKPLVIPKPRNIDKRNRTRSPRPRLPRASQSDATPTGRMCVICKSTCSCQNNTAVFDFISTISEDTNYLAMVGDVEHYVPATKPVEDEGESPNSTFKVPPKPAPRRRRPKAHRVDIPATKRRGMKKRSKYIKCSAGKQRYCRDDTSDEGLQEKDLYYFQELTKKSYTRSVDDLYQLASLDVEDVTCPDCSGPRLSYDHYLNWHCGRVKNSRHGVEEIENHTTKTLFQLLFEYITKKPLPFNTLGMKESTWTKFLLSFNCEKSRGFELGDWRGLAEVLGLSASDIGIVEQQCCKSSRIASEFILLYWSQCPISKFPYTRSTLLDILASLERLDLVEIIQNTE